MHSNAPLPEYVPGGHFKLTGHCRDQPAERPTDGRAFGHDGVVSSWLQRAHLEKDRRFGGAKPKRIEVMNREIVKLAERRGRIAAMQRHESDSDDDDDSGWDDSD